MQRPMLVLASCALVDPLPAIWGAAEPSTDCSFIVGTYANEGQTTDAYRSPLGLMLGNRDLVKPKEGAVLEVTAIGDTETTS
jgi:hypothetical protein